MAVIMCASLRPEEGMSTAPRPKPSNGVMSAKMLAVIVAMLAVIFVPVAVLTMETSKVIVIVTNTDSESAASCEMWLSGAGFGISMVTIGPGEQREWNYPVKPGTYEIDLYYWFSDLNYSGSSYWKTVHVLPFETERVEVELERWS